MTDIQQAQLDELLSKIKLTDAQAIKRDHLQQKPNTIELSRGAKTLIEEYINRERAPILSEKQMRNTISYRRQCKMMEMMHRFLL